MLKIGRLKIYGDGTWPRSRSVMKARLRRFARGLGLELNFVIRKKETGSWCQVATARATICEEFQGKLYSMPAVMYDALHETAHWIQFNEGMFRKFFGEPYYDAWQNPKTKDVLRLGLRAERHADLLARKLAMELFGIYLIANSPYDKSREKEAKAFIQMNYG